LWEVILLLNLDGCEKWHYPPRNSKWNPAEQPHVVIKHQLRGHNIPLKDYSETSFDQALLGVRQHLAGSKYAGEPVTIHLAHKKTDHRLTPSDLLRDFCLERQNQFLCHKPWWCQRVNPKIIEEWKKKGDKFVKFAELECKVQQLQQHLLFSWNNH